jgi:glutamyl-tRNA synthetase
MERTILPARTRFAPSPTGRLHVGGGRTALYAYLLARQTGGQFLLRLEDTDLKRTVPGSEQEIAAGLKWLGLEWDEGFDIGGPYGSYRQSERREIYQVYTRKLLDSGHAFYCFCTPERLDRVRQEQQKMKIPPHYDGTCRRLFRRKQQTSRQRRKICCQVPNAIEGTTTVVAKYKTDQC